MRAKQERQTPFLKNSSTNLSMKYILIHLDTQNNLVGTDYRLEIWFIYQEFIVARTEFNEKRGGETAKQKHCFCGGVVRRLVRPLS